MVLRSNGTFTRTFLRFAEGLRAVKAVSLSFRQLLDAASTEEEVVALMAIVVVKAHPRDAESKSALAVGPHSVRFTLRSGLGLSWSVDPRGFDLANETPDGVGNQWLFSLHHPQGHLIPEDSSLREAALKQEWTEDMVPQQTFEPGRLFPSGIGTPFDFVMNMDDATRAAVSELTPLSRLLAGESPAQIMADTPDNRQKEIWFRKYFEQYLASQGGPDDDDEGEWLLGKNTLAKLRPVDEEDLFPRHSTLPPLPPPDELELLKALNRGRQAATNDFRRQDFDDSQAGRDQHPPGYVHDDVRGNEWTRDRRKDYLED